MAKIDIGKKDTSEVPVSLDGPAEMSGLNQSLPAASAWNELREMFSGFLKKLPWQNGEKNNQEFCRRLIEACRLEKPSFDVREIVNYLCKNIGTQDFQVIADTFVTDMYN